MTRQINYQKNIQIRNLDIENQQSDIDEYKDIIIKLIPSEIIAAYTTLIPIIYTQEKPEILHKMILLFLFVLTPIYLYKIAKIIEVKQLIIASFGFLVWALSINSPYTKILGYDAQFMMSLILILYTLVMPLIYIKTIKN